MSTPTTQVPLDHESDEPKAAQYSATETRLRSIVKTVSWRALATLTTAIIAGSSLIFYDTGDASGKAAAVGTIALFEVPSKLLLYYLHERFWSHLAWGRPGAK